MDDTELSTRIFEAEFADPITRHPIAESRQIVTDLLKLFEGKKALIAKLQPSTSFLVSGLETQSIAFTIAATQDRQVLKQSALRIHAMDLKLTNIFTSFVTGTY
jgi:hypothetical protein